LCPVNNLGCGRAARRQGLHLTGAWRLQPVQQGGLLVRPDIANFQQIICAREERQHFRQGIRDLPAGSVLSVASRHVKPISSEVPLACPRCAGSAACYEFRRLRQCPQNVSAIHHIDRTAPAGRYAGYLDRERSL
jgi:hypothetical protein